MIPNVPNRVRWWCHICFEVYVIDAYVKGNVGRFLNHACGPSREANVSPVYVYVMDQAWGGERKMDDMSILQSLDVEICGTIWLIRKKTCAASKKKTNTYSMLGMSILQDCRRLQKHVRIARQCCIKCLFLLRSIHSYVIICIYYTST